MTTMYACTYVVKETQEDFFSEGLIGPRYRIISEPSFLVSESLGALIKAIADRWYVDVSGFNMMDDGCLTVSQLERNDSYLPSKTEVALWQAGKIKLYLSDYYFHIERREVAPIAVEEFLELCELQADRE